MKKFPIGIVSAGVLGVMLIIGSLYVSVQNMDELPANSVTSTTLRQPIEIRDENNNGIPDWEESVRDKIFKSIETPTSTALTVDSADYTPPTTLTGRFSEAFLQDYLEGKMSGEDFSNPEAFIASAIQAVDDVIQSNRHTRAVLTIIPTTPETIRNYGNELVAITDRHAIPHDHELQIMQSAAEKNDPAILKQLTPIHTAYRRIIDDSLAMPVPDIFAQEHVALLNAYESVFTDIASMEHLFTDPLLALARLHAYTNNIEVLFGSLRAIGAKLDANNIAYTNTEPGAFFYIFDAL